MACRWGVRRFGLNGFYNCPSRSSLPTSLALGTAWPAASSRVGNSFDKVYRSSLALFPVQQIPPRVNSPPNCTAVLKLALSTVSPATSSPRSSRVRVGKKSGPALTTWVVQVHLPDWSPILPVIRFLPQISQGLLLVTANFVVIAHFQTFRFKSKPRQSSKPLLPIAAPTSYCPHTHATVSRELLFRSVHSLPS